MAITLDSQCLICHLRRNVETAQRLGDRQTATAFAKALMELYLSAPEAWSSPCLAPGTTALFQKFYGLEADRFRREKQTSNQFVLARLPDIQARIDAAPDPVFAGLQFAILGNYIDFSALQQEVSFEALDAMLQEALRMTPDAGSYAAFQTDLARAQRLLYLTDNAGEIGFDRLFAQAIARRYPHLSITFCVRGAPAMNDATREDAALMGVPFPVIDNGNAIPGTELSQLGAEAKAALESADVIVAKGQGNTETLLGCGYNIYYAFLIKCPRFIELFHREKFTPMFFRERAGIPRQ
ncbi:MAG TPA: DUF89 family protein [Candidatus Faecousia intestinigallinarum]|nr:DUF89 family protein [Candidatus Faecousia intestinigallinarum]